MHISEINIYPIKSLKGISLDSAVVEPRGLQFDRRWMLTDLDNRFFTQREFPQMATIAVRIENGELRVENEKAGTIAIPFEAETGVFQDVTIWHSVCRAEVYGAGVNRWFSDVLETDCQIVYMGDDSRRSVNQRFDSGNDIVSFADGYPLMVLGEASLEDLNYRIKASLLEDYHHVSSQKTAAANPPKQGGEPWTPLPMNRFRPNLVVSGSEAFAEDKWKRIRIGDAVFRSTKPCERCVVTTVEQSRGEFDGNEPLKTLATYRMAKDVIPDTFESLGVGANAVLFGQNLIAENSGGKVRVGDRIEVLESLG